MKRNLNYLQVVTPDEKKLPPPKPLLTVIKPTVEIAAAKSTGNWRSQWPVYLSIMKPITWIPVVWSFWCGAVAAGHLSFDLVTVSKLLVGFLLSGPLLCGMGQAINDYFDREVDAVNEPWRAIPSGKLTIAQVYQLTGLLGFLGLLAAYYLGEIVLLLSFLGIFLAHNYSAPPFRLKANTWLGPLSSGVSYIFLPWLAASSVFGGISWQSVIIAAIYSLGGVGIMILNDFKSIKGDFQLKLPSVPVVYGTAKAARIAIAIIDSTQLAIVALALIEKQWLAAGIITLLILPQILLQTRFVKKPLSLTVWYQARAQNFLVLGMLIAAWLLI